ncbi:MAG: hypothetical protein RIT45_1945, partial [Pseudomonadota bacterium]
RDLVDRAESEIEQAAALVESVPSPELERLANVLLELAEQVAKARHPRLVLELGVVRLCRAAPLVDVGALAARVDGLLRGAGAHLPQLRASAARMTAVTPSVPQGNARGREPAPSARAGRDDDAPEPDPAPTATSNRRPGRSLRDADLGVWRDAIAEKMGDRNLASVLDHAVVVESGAGQVGLGFANAFHYEQARKADVLQRLAAGASEAFGGSFEVWAVGVEPRARTESLAARAQRARVQTRDAQLGSLRRHPALRAVLDVFPGDVSQIRTQSEINADRPDVH